jgi:hypothetical protein
VILSWSGSRERNVHRFCDRNGQFTVVRREREKQATLGEDSGSTDYNLGDDGLVVTDARGRIVR